MFISLLYLLISVRIKVPVGESSNIPYLSGKALTDEISKSQNSIVFFVDSSPDLDFADFAIREYKSKIKFIRADINEGKQYNCQFSPCIVPFEKSSVVRTEAAPLQPAQFLLWAKNTLTPGIINVTSPGQLHNLLIEHDPIILGVDQKGRHKSVPSNFTVYLVASSILSAFNVSVNKGYYLFRPADHELLPLSKGTIQELLSATPVLDINEVNITAKTFLAGYIIDESDTESCATEIEILKNLASKYSEKIHFTTLYGKPAELYRKASDLMTLKEPFFFMFNTSELEGGRWLIYRKPQLNNAAFVEAFVQRVLDDKEYFTIVSEEIPVYSPGEAFKKVVAYNFDELVINNNDDVLVAFTAPWCHHCKDLKPVLNETAIILKDTKAKIYYMDGSANDVPECVPAIDGYPTIYFWPAGKKSEEPIKYNSYRKFSNILNFVVNKSTNAIEVPPYNETEIQERIRYIQHPPTPNPEVEELEEEIEDEQEQE